jgi:hypothetical protein
MWLNQYSTPLWATIVRGQGKRGVLGIDYKLLYGMGLKVIPLDKGAISDA